MRKAAFSVLYLCPCVCSMCSTTSERRSKVARFLLRAPTLVLSMRALSTQARIGHESHHNVDLHAFRRGPRCIHVPLSLVPSCSSLPSGRAGEEVLRVPPGLWLPYCAEAAVRKVICCSLCRPRTIVTYEGAPWFDHSSES